METVTEKRRTSVITMRNVATGHLDTIRLCDPECRDVFLLDLGLRGSGGRSAFRSHGEAEVDVAWNHQRYAVAWKRNRPTALPCDHCGEVWRTRPLPAPLPRTPAQIAAQANLRAFKAGAN